MRNNLTIILFLSTISFFAQDTIQPNNQIVIANKTHTNRDFLNHSLVDIDGNIILVGSTENDFTFNDVKVIKLDQNLNELWQKEISFDNEYSFDRIFWSHVGQDNRITLLCRSLYKSNSETLFVVVLNSEGELIWQLPFSDLENTDYGVNPYEILANYNASGNLEIAFTNLGLGSDQDFWVYEISISGVILKKYKQNSLFGFNLSSPTGMAFAEGSYFTIRRETLENTPYVQYNLIEMSENLRHDNLLTFLSEEELGFIGRSQEQQLDYNEEGNVVWFLNHSLTLDGDFFSGYSIYFLDSEGNLIKAVPIDLSMDKYVIGLYQDQDGNTVVVSNAKIKGSDNTLKIFIEKYSSAGDLIFTNSFNEDIWGYTTFFSESTVNIYTDFGKVLIFDFDLNLTTEMNLSPVDALGYNPTNIHLINGDGFLTGTLINSMYEGSDFYGQLDFSARKFSASNEISQYVFSGLGTSKTGNNWIKKSKSGEYVVHITDKLGPDNLNIGGSRSKEYSYNYYYDADLNPTGVTENVPKVDWYRPSETETESFDISGNQYQYTFDGDGNVFTLFRNGNEIWRKPWEENNGYFREFNVDSKGNLIFRVSNYNGSSNVIASLSLAGEFNTLNYLGELHFMKVLENDWIFTHTDRSFLVYSPGLELISRKATVDLQTYSNSNYTPSMQIGNSVVVMTSQVLSTDFGEREILIYDQYGNLQKNAFLHANLRPQYAFLEGDDLITLTKDNRKVQHGFSWQVGIVNKFEDFVGGIVPNFDLEDFDLDGVPNYLDRCENTALGNLVNEYGCNLFEIKDDNFSIQSIGETCFAMSNGQINIVATQTLNYQAKLFKDDIEILSMPFEETISFKDLQGGKYQLCLTVKEISEYNKCFDLTVDTIEKLYVSSKMSEDYKSITLELKGGKFYTIYVNDLKYTTTKNQIEIPLEQPLNSIKVTTDKNCQGIFEEEVITTGKSAAYPNPTEGHFSIFLGENAQKKVPYAIYNSSGVLVQSGEVNPEYGNLSISVSNMPNGQYYCVLEIRDKKTTYKIIKR